MRVETKRRVQIVIVVGVLLVGALPIAHAENDGGRTESGSYVGFSHPLIPDEYQGLRVNGWLGRCDQTAGAGCVRFEPSGQDRFVTIDIADASGRPISYYAVQYIDQRVRWRGLKCGVDPYTFRVEVGFYLEVYVLPRGGSGPCLGAPTTGTVTATFSTTKGDNS